MGIKSWNRQNTRINHIIAYISSVEHHIINTVNSLENLMEMHIHKHYSLIAKTVL